MSDSDSDYNVEEFIKPDRIGAPLINDESADILGNFDDKKKQKIQENRGNIEEDPFADGSENDEGVSNDHLENMTNESDENDTIQLQNKKRKLESTSSEQKDNNTMNSNPNQINDLMRGLSKSNRHVLYVTNLNFATTKERLCEYFESCGRVKSVRIPKRRSGGFAFVEMEDMDSFKKALKLHNTTLDEWEIKIQLSEAGKRKSANKKNILKQKNRKLAELRNETKTFTKSGKNYDKSIKKEIEKNKLQQAKIWARRKAKKMRQSS